MKQKQPKKLTDNEEEVCLACFQEFLEQPFLLQVRSKIYDILASANLLRFNNSQVLNFYEDARRILTAEEMKKPERQRKLYLFTGERSLTVIFKAKVLALESFFARLDAEGKHLKDILI